MQSYNKVILLGNLTHTPVIRHTAKGLATATFGLAMNRSSRSSDGAKLEETTYVDVKAWGSQAEIAQKYLTRGRPVHLEGRLKLEQWQDKKTGTQRSKLLVIAERIIFLGAPEGGERAKHADTESPISSSVDSLSAAQTAPHTSSPTYYTPQPLVSTFGEEHEEYEEEDDDSDPIDREMTEEEIELCEEIDDDVWREKARDFLILRRQLQVPHIDMDEASHIRHLMQDLKEDMHSLRKIHKIADDLRSGKPTDFK